MLALRLRFARTKKISVSAYHLYKKPGISGERSNETVHPVEMFRKKLKPSKVLLTFLSFTETTENILYHCCMWITNATPPPEGTRKISFFLFFLFFFFKGTTKSHSYFGCQKIPVIFVEKSFTEISSQMLKAIRRLKDISAKESRSY